VTRERRALLVAPLLIYSIVIGCTFAPDVHATLAKAFGESPFGYPVTMVVAMAEVVLLLPLLWPMQHFGLIAMQSLKDGNGVGGIRILIYAFQVGGRHPHLRRSQYICLSGLVYFVAICGVWISYASAHNL